MGRLERKLGSMVRINLLRDVHPWDRFQGWVAGVKDRLVASGTDVADLVVLEGENRSLRHELGELKSIIEELKRQDLRRRSVQGEEAGTIHLTRRPDEAPIPDSIRGFVVEPLANPYRERVLQADLDATRRQVLALMGQLKNVVELCRQTLETRPFISNPEAQALVISIMTVAQPSGPRVQPQPQAGNRWPENEPKFDGPSR